MKLLAYFGNKKISVLTFIGPWIGIEGFLVNQSLFLILCDVMKSFNSLLQILSSLM